MEQNISPKYKLTKDDLRSIGIGLVVALAGAFVTYITEIIAHIDFGEWTPVVVTLNSVLANAIRKFISENQYIKK